MNTNKSNYEIISKIKRWNDLLHNDRFIIKSDFYHDKTLQCTYQERSEFHMGSTRTNCVIASLTTAYGRLKLYDLISKLEQRCLYFDTGKICFFLYV